MIDKALAQHLVPYRQLQDQSYNIYRTNSSSLRCGLCEKTARREGELQYVEKREEHRLRTVRYIVPGTLLYQKAISPLLGPQSRLGDKLLRT